MHHILTDTYNPKPSNSKITGDQQQFQILCHENGPNIPENKANQREKVLSLPIFVLQGSLALIAP